MHRRLAFETLKHRQLLCADTTVREFLSMQTSAVNDFFAVPGGETQGLLLTHIDGPCCQLPFGWVNKKISEFLSGHLAFPTISC